MHKIFVYGSLMSGFRNHFLLEGSKFVGPAETVSNFTLISLGAFPALLRGGTTSVKGEVYEVDDDIQHTLDSLEGHPTWYRRELITLMGGDVVEGYIFLRPPTLFTVVGSGDWSKWLDRDDID